MPSSTSSFETYTLSRIIPNHRWGRLTIVTGVVTAVCVLGWEATVRRMGYFPTLNDTTDLWAEHRTRLNRAPASTVAIGASRTLFDLNLDVYEQGMGERPIQLSTVATNASLYLEDLATMESFTGTVVMGVVPGLLFAPAGLPIEAPTEHLARYRDWSPSQRSGHRLGMFLQRRFAFIQQEDLTLNLLLRRVPLPPRPGVGPRFPDVPMLATIDGERQTKMTERTATNQAFQQRVQQIWMFIFTPPPPPPHLDEAGIHAMVEGFRTTGLARIEKSVRAIQARGGKVVFIRWPSTGDLRELEAKFSPREAYWDQVLAVTGAPGIHFEDHAELRDFDCPEWSHLTAEDAEEFTRRLIPHFQELRAQGLM